MAIIKTKVSGGIVIGVEHEWGTLFKGIPYAAPPVGDLRFASPRPAEKWSGERLCDTFPPDTFRIVRPIPGMPKNNYPALIDEPHIYSEDCLYINIWTPADSIDDRLPVMFWLYGNGGSSHHPAVKGDIYAQKGVVLVTFNYRQDVFGCTGLKELADREPDGSTGANGPQDILFALKWVNDNITAFGGDPDNITVFGHSAGGIFTKFLLTCPQAEGLFQHAICMSGGGTWDIDPIYTKEQKCSWCQEILDKAGWSLDDIMTKSTEEVYEVLKKYEQTLNLPKQSMLCSLFLASEDDVLIDRYFGEKLYDGYVNTSVDVMAGMLVEEWRNIPCQVPGGIAGYEKEFAMASVVSWAQRNAERGFKPIYPYFFEHKMPEDGHWMRHGDEVAYAFGTLDVYGKPWTEFDYLMSDTVVDYWTTFAKTGNPNCPGRPEWQPFTLDNPVTMHFADAHIICENISGSAKQQEAIRFLLEHPGILNNPFPPVSMK